MFCVATAPTAARACAQRAATAGEDDAMAMPNIRDDDARAAMEKVTDETPSSLQIKSPQE
jgi:hypothetical protein